MNVWVIGFSNLDIVWKIWDFKPNMVVVNRFNLTGLFQLGRFPGALPAYFDKSPDMIYKIS